MHRYLRRRVGSDLAQDLAAETFTQAFRARRRFRGTDALPWGYGIAANLSRDNHRREERRLRAYARLSRRDRDTYAGDEVDARLDAIALRAGLAEALAALSPALREVLLLHAWAELSHEEIAEALGLSAAAVRTRLHRARGQVAAALTNRGARVLEGGTVG